MLAAIVGALRIYLGLTYEPETMIVNVYKDFAHIYVGYLFAKSQWVAFWILCVLEVVMAIVTRM